MKAKAKRRTGPAKLDMEDVALIRAWAAGPGRHLTVWQQGRMLHAGVPGWWTNWVPVSKATLFGILRHDSWVGVEPDQARLAEWHRYLETLRPPGRILGI